MNPSTETISLLKQAMAAPNAELAKAWTQSGSAVSGITAYDLEAPAKQLYPVITPLRNMIPRVSGKGGIQANWRAITGINTGNIQGGVGQGNRGKVQSSTTADYIAAYRGLGLEDYATFEADYASRGFDDVKALAVEGLLRALMIVEELVDLGGNTSVALGTTPTPTVVASTTGGTLAAATYSVICVALTHAGFLGSTVAAGILGQVTQTNADASTDTFGGGSAQKSAAATGVVASGTTGSLTATVTAVRGAVAYAWFWGAAAAETLGAITTINSVAVTATATGTQLASAIPNGAADNSTNALVYDGLLYQALKSGSNGYFAALATGTAGVGTTLTADTRGGVTEIDTALKSFWDNYRLSPDTIWVSSQEMNNISAKILSSSSANAQRFVFNVEQGTLQGGVMIKSYMNKFAMGGAQEIPIKLHPNMPAGTILFTTIKLPYPLSNVQNVVQKRVRQEYYQLEWPLRSRKYEYGVYVDQVLQNFFPPAFGVITNIANG